MKGQAFDPEQVIQALKDKAHALLLTYCEIDPETGCWIWTRAWNWPKAHGVMRVAGRRFTCSRVSYWVYVGAFDLFDPSVRIYHRRCKNPACFNYQHLDRAGGAGEVNQRLASLGRFRRKAC